jgi:hypothetical protein
LCMCVEVGGGCGEYLEFARDCFENRVVNTRVKVDDHGHNIGWIWIGSIGGGHEIARDPAGW